MKECNNIYIGLDVHKSTIVVAIARGDRGEVAFHGTIENTPSAMRKLLK